MPVTHVVQPGECCATLAKRYGLIGWKPIVALGDNAALFAQRKNPHVLKPGDVVVVPDPEPRLFDGATDQRHSFVFAQSPTKLRLVLKRPDGTALDGVRFVLRVGDDVLENTTGGDGVVEHPVDPMETTGTLALWFDPASVAPSVELTLDVGALIPADFVAGAQARLRNLGYFVGSSSETLDPATREALRAFQDDNGIAPSGDLDAATQAKLVTVHDEQ
jgi:Putative peptidoglycan binding domain